MGLSSLFVLSGAFLGWSLGANDAANIFGTAVGTRVIKYRTAVIITAVMVMAGAAREGQNGITKLSSFADSNAIFTGLAAFIVMLVAALTVTGMTVLKFPVSTSQCVIGSMIGWGLSQGSADFSGTTDFLSAWIITPLGALVICFLLSLLTERFVEGRIKNLAHYDMFIKSGFLISGTFGAYSLGANNTANATGIFLHIPGIFDQESFEPFNNMMESAHIPFAVTPTFMAALIGGLSIAIGVLTFSKAVMFTVGEGITTLSPLSGFLVVLSCSIVMYIYAIVGVPVSSSQAVVGALIGAGFTKGVRSVKLKTLRNIFLAWFATPSIAGLVSFVVGKVVA